jgi:hypothetical protein
MISHIICNSVEGTGGYFEEEGKERQEECFKPKLQVDEHT